MFLKLIYDSYDLQTRVFPVRVVYNEPANSCRSSQVVGWETESTAPSTATIQPRSAVAVLEAKHVAPHAKPPWHSFTFHKNSVQTLTLYTSTWESKCRNSFKNMKSNSISTNKIRIFEPLKNCWWLMVKFQVGNCLRLSVINPPTPEPPSAPHRRKSKCHKSGSVLEHHQWCNGCHCNWYHRCLYKAPTEKKKVNEVDDPKHRKHLGFNGNLNLKLDGGSWDSRCNKNVYQNLTPSSQNNLDRVFLTHFRLYSSHLCIFQNLHHRNRTFFLPRNCTILASTTTSHGTRIPIRNLKGIAQLRHQLKLRNGQLGACAWLQTATSPLNRWSILRGQKVYNTSAVSVLCNSFRLWTDT